MQIETFGKTVDGKEVKCYTLENKNGMKLKLMDLGATMVSLFVKDKEEKFRDVILGYDDPMEYQRNTCYFGAVIGRNANRIAGARCRLAGKEYQLEANDNGNNLHSGKCGFHNVIWDVSVENANNQKITFSYLSKDMEQGFPGNMKATVVYTLTDADEMTIDYFAETDKTTIANFTNHAYYNLGGHDSGSIEEHEICIKADYYTPVSSEEAIPKGVLDTVFGTPMDFSSSKKIGKDIEKDFIQLKYAGGYDHNYVLDTKHGGMKLAATAKCEKTKIAMDFYTDCMGIQFYTGNFIKRQLGKNGAYYDFRHGFCLEPQYYPNAVNDEKFASPILHPGETYEAHTKVKFSVYQ
ncbi:MAG: aldose epimerase family protein [Roseburia sp.]